MLDCKVSNQHLEIEIPSIEYVLNKLSKSIDAKKKKKSPIFFHDEVDNRHYVRVTLYIRFCLKKEKEKVYVWNYSVFICGRQN